MLIERYCPVAEEDTEPYPSFKVEKLEERGLQWTERMLGCLDDALCYWKEVGLFCAVENADPVFAAPCLLNN